MPIPRFTDPKSSERYDVSLVCPKCHWAIAKDSITEKWDTCRSCGSAGLLTRRYNYGQVAPKR